MNSMYGAIDAQTTEDSFTIPAVVHTPNVNNGTVTYLLQIWDNGHRGTTDIYNFYVNRTRNDRSGSRGNDTYFERSLSYITALPVT